MSAVPKSVASAVAPSTQNGVPILTKPQLGPYSPMSGNAIVPIVPTVNEPNQETPQPAFGGAYGGIGTPFQAGSEGAPSVPGMNGTLFRKGPIDPHYMSEEQQLDPYAKVNNPPTRGMFTFVKEYLNGIALGVQNRESTGWNNRAPQQRTSVMRVTPPPHGMGFTQQTYTPRINPQSVNTAKYLPATGTVAYGGGSPGRYTRGVLNSDTLGAGQTAGGVGGNNYTPQPGPPAQTSTAGNAGVSSMPTWG
jgi:hypothetical protein